MVDGQRIRGAIKRFGSEVDAFDLMSMFRWMVTVAAWTLWAEQIVRAIRGEDAKSSRTTTYVTALYVALLANGTANKAREAIAFRESISEMRQLLREGSQDATQRDERAAAMHTQLYNVTVKMAWVAGFTLLAAFVTLVVTIVK